MDTLYLKRLAHKNMNLTRSTDKNFTKFNIDNNEKRNSSICENC